MSIEWKWNSRQPTEEGVEVETTFDSSVSASRVDAKPPEFKAFEELAQKVITVPKHELDERRKG